MIINLTMPNSNTRFSCVYDSVWVCLSDIFSEKTINDWLELPSTFCFLNEVGKIQHKQIIEHNNIDDWVYVFQELEKIKRTKSKKGYIYVLESNSKIKIGFSNNVEKRLKQHKTSNSDIKLIACYEGTLNEEKQLHIDLANYSIAGEWYKKTVIPVLQSIKTNPIDISEKIPKPVKQTMIEDYTRLTITVKNDEIWALSFVGFGIAQWYDVKYMAEIMLGTLSLLMPPLSSIDLENTKELNKTLQKIIGVIDLEQEQVRNFFEKLETLKTKSKFQPVSEN